VYNTCPACGMEGNQWHQHRCTTEKIAELQSKLGRAEYEYIKLAEKASLDDAKLHHRIKDLESRLQAAEKHVAHWMRLAEARRVVIDSAGLPLPIEDAVVERRGYLCETQRVKCDDCGEIMSRAGYCGCGDIGRPENWRDDVVPE